MARRLFRGLLWLAGILAALTALAWFLTLPGDPGDFYDPPAEPGGVPGSLVRTEPLAVSPAGMEGWRILYATTRGDGSPVLSSAYVLVPAGHSGPLPLIAWAHGTTGVAPGCGLSAKEPLGSDVPGLASFAAEGWALVATDYPGLGSAGPHAYQNGPDAGRAVLDAIRAARSIEALAAPAPVVVWGHSQGGHAALWTGIEAEGYAPDLRLAGVAALAPASDLPRLIAGAGGSVFGRITTAFVVEAAHDTVPLAGFRDNYRVGVGWLTRDIARRCVFGFGALFSVAEALLLPGDGVLRADAPLPGLRDWLAAQTPAAPFAAPLLVAQGLGDDLVLPGVQRDFVAGLCGRGQVLVFRGYEGADHLSVLEESAALPDLLAFTRDRFAGLSFAPSCP